MGFNVCFEIIRQLVQSFIFTWPNKPLQLPLSLLKKTVFMAAKHTMWNRIKNVPMVTKGNCLYFLPSNRKYNSEFAG